MKSYHLTRIPLNEIDEAEFHSFPDKTVFTTKAWLSFVEEETKARDFILRISDDDGALIGYFSSFIILKFGIRILGSPFAGWGTCFMGLDLFDRSNQFEIIKNITEYAMKTEHVMYIEIIDRNISVAAAEAHGIKAYPVGTLQLDINKDDEGLFKQMKTDCRNFIRQFSRRGAKLEFAEPNEEFAKDYYDELKDVFAKQGMVPTYSLEKVNCLLRNLKDSGELICIRVRNPEGEPIATSLFLGFNKTFFFWGGASLRPQQHYRPNEFMIWTAIQYWRDSGCEVFDMVGIRDYKRKFGSHEEYYARMVFSRYSILIKMRDFAKKIYFALLKVRGKLKRKKINLSRNDNSNKKVRRSGENTVQEPVQRDENCCN